MKSIPTAPRSPRIKCYEIVPAKKAEFLVFCKDKVHVFIKDVDKVTRGDFFTCQRNGQLFLVVLLVDGQDHPWDGPGGIAGLPEFLIEPNPFDFVEEISLRFPPEL